MLPITISNLFDKAHRGPWTKGSRDLDFRTELDLASKTALLIFQGSKSRQDWLNNFRFFLKIVRPTEAYKDMPVRWKAHRGLLQPYKESSQQIDFGIPSWVEHLTIVGFSQGAAYATFAHEDFWYRRSIDSPYRLPGKADQPRIKTISTYAFGGPRVFGRRAVKALAKRLAGLVRVYVSGDIVTRVPPWLFSFRHAGVPIRLGRRRLLPGVRYHFHSAYREGLRKASQ
jgi:triacylglycerol lipase